MNEGPEKEQDLKDVMSAEKRRGTRRRPLDAEQMRNRKRLVENLLKAKLAKDERAYLEMLRKAGYGDDSPEFARARKMFHSP